MPPKMHRNQRTSRVITNFIRSQIKVSHKTLQYINFQNFNPHAFRAEFICFHCFFSREDTSIHTFCEKTPLILTLIYFCIIFQSNYILIYVIIFLYYINSQIATPTCNQCSSSIATSGLICNVNQFISSEDIRQSLVGFCEPGALRVNGSVLIYSS